MSDWRIGNSQHWEVQNGKGDVIGHVKTYSTNGVRWLTNVWVDPEQRQKGMARALVMEALAMFGREDMYLQIQPYTDQPRDTEALAAWYGRFGFRPTDVPGVLVRRAL